MKFPFTPRRPVEAPLALLPNHAPELLAGLRQELEALHSYVREVERICEIRRLEIEQLKEVETLCEYRRKQIATMQSERALAEHAHLRLLEALKTARLALLPGGVPPASPRRPLPVVFAVDMEPDKREVDRQDPSWHATVEFFRRLPELRERVNTIAGSGGPLVFTWLVRADPQVEIANGNTAYAFHRFAGELRASVAAGDEIGLHVHPWRWAEAEDRWMQDHGNDEWINHCIQVACDTYRQHFGKAPASYSNGDRFLSNALVRKLNEMGIKVDFSLECLPGADQLVSDELASGPIPDASNVPNRAYRPSAEDFLQPDPARRDGVLLMPLTADPSGHLSAWAPPAIFERALELILMNPAELTHLAFVARTDIALSTSWERFATNLETLAHYVKEGALQFATGEQAWDRARKWVDGEAAE